MNYQVITTGDGSSSLYVPGLDETYHSRHGALQEAQHVFIKAGLDYWKKASENKGVRILEVGFGTGLNAWLAAVYAEQNNYPVEYIGIEKYPLNVNTISRLNFVELFRGDFEPVYRKIHQEEWEENVSVTPFFNLLKQPLDIRSFQSSSPIDLVFFDAFGPRVQSEMWTEEIFVHLSQFLRVGSILVTYCAQGQFRRNLKVAGFRVEKIPGPPGEREMVRAYYEGSD